MSLPRYLYIDHVIPSADDIDPLHCVALSPKRQGRFIDGFHSALNVIVWWIHADFRVLIKNTPRESTINLMSRAKEWSVQYKTDDSLEQHITRTKRKDVECCKLLQQNEWVPPHRRIKSATTWKISEWFRRMSCHLQHYCPIFHVHKTHKETARIRII